MAQEAQNPRQRAGDWLNTKEACEYLGVALRTLYRQIDAGQLPASKMGRVIRLRQHELDAWIERQRVQPGELASAYSSRDRPDTSVIGATPARAVAPDALPSAAP